MSDSPATVSGAPVITAQPAPVEAAKPIVSAAPQVKNTPAPESKSGKVVASSATPVGTVSTPQEIKDVIEQKIINSSDTIYSKELQSLFDRVAATKNPTVINSIDTIKQYMVDMGPNKPMTSDVGARHQVTFFRALRAVVDFSGADFQIAFVTVLKLFDEFKNGVFHERYVFRFMDSVVMTPEDRRAYERIVNLIKIAAPVAGRKEALRQVNFQKTLQYTFTDEGKRRILSFFNV